MANNPPVGRTIKTHATVLPINLLVVIHSRATLNNIHTASLLSGSLVDLVLERRFAILYMDMVQGSHHYRTYTRVSWPRAIHFTSLFDALITRITAEASVHVREPLQMSLYAENNI